MGRTKATRKPGEAWKPYPCRFRKVNGTYEPAGIALTKAGQAIELNRQRRWKDAAVLMHEAAAGYPEMAQPSTLAGSYDTIDAFYSRDFDLLMTLTEEQMKLQPGLGLSIGMQAFPSTTDLKSLWALAPVRAKRGDLLAIVGIPLIGLLYLLNFEKVRPDISPKRVSVLR